ncbi:uncharacterized protein At4g06598-like [Bidens hawaiensis]|uniref:uncharacterized protein At4g06598-like n=1 Tax=Bidens hawaiensis TaxID=980011 RepID=UPI0040493969
MVLMTGNCDLRNMYSGKQYYSLPPKSPFSNAPYYSEYAPNTSNGSKTMIPERKNGNSLHQRTSSEILVTEDKPYWLDELLDEPDTPVKRGHRRSSSDSFTYIEAANNNNIQHAAQVEYRLRNMSSGPSFASQQLGLYKPNPMTKTENRVNRTKSMVDKQDGIDSFTQDAHTSSETDIKHSKQQFAQRSRVRKLQYIAELERNVQALQAEGCEVSGELKFLNQKSVILTMENKALKQRLENLAQEQLIKYLEQEVLEKEIGRLRALYKQQRQPPTNQPPVSRGSTNMESQFANLSLKTRGLVQPVHGSLRMSSEF